MSSLVGPEGARGCLSLVGPEGVELGAIWPAWFPPAWVGLVYLFSFPVHCCHPDFSFRLHFGYCFHPDFSLRPPIKSVLVCAPCIMHRCVIYPVEPTPHPSHFPLRIFTPSTPSFPFSTSILYPPDPLLLFIFHSGSLPRPESGEVTFFLSFNYCPCGVRGRNFLLFL